MGIEKIFILAFSGIVILALTILAFRKTLYIWILFAGLIGIPFLSVRNSSLMYSELLLAPLIFIWLTEKKFGLGLVKLSELSSMHTKIEKSMWAMIGAFTISSVFGIVFTNPSVGGEHAFILGKLMALFLYIAPVMAALIVADSIRSFNDVSRICLLLITLGIFSFIPHLPKIGELARALQGRIGWTWMSVTILFSFSLSYFLFHPKTTKRIQNIIVSLILGIQVFSMYFLGTASYKAIILANYAVVLTVFYYRSKITAFLVVLLSIIVFLATIATFNYYVDQETQEGSWGSHGSARTAIWKHSLLIFKERPIFGIGPYNYTDYSLYVADKSKYSDERWGVMTSAHGQYIQILVETGVVGTLAFLWFMIELFKLLKYFIEPHPDYKINIISSAIAAILVSRLAVAMVGDYLIAQYHNAGLQSFCVTVYFWICLGVLIGLKRIIMLEDKPSEADDGFPIEVASQI